MFQHLGFRSLWPVVLLLPWFFVGLAYLLAALLHRDGEVRPLATPALKFSRRARSQVTRTNAFARTDPARTLRFKSAVPSRARRATRNAA
jgi:hypothetical protein